LQCGPHRRGRNRNPEHGEEQPIPVGDFLIYGRGALVTWIGPMRSAVTGVSVCAMRMAYNKKASPAPHAHKRLQLLMELKPFVIGWSTDIKPPELIRADAIDIASGWLARSLPSGPPQAFRCGA
jgi:hypothetical protein